MWFSRRSIKKKTVFTRFPEMTAVRGRNSYSSSRTRARAQRKVDGYERKSNYIPRRVQRAQLRSVIIPARSFGGKGERETETVNYYSLKITTNINLTNETRRKPKVACTSCHKFSTYVRVVQTVGNIF